MLKTWNNRRALTILAKMRYLKDLENNKTIFSKYHRPATNQKALELGFSLRLTKMGHRF